MSEASVSPAEILVRMRVPDPEEPGLFVLGCFERPATLYMQQVRALNLIYALSAVRPVSDRSAPLSVVVVGAGAGGLTAAAAAAIQRWRVTVLERIGDVLSLAGSVTPVRWLHPRIYDWPAEGSEESRTDLGVLDWEAGPANKVVEDLRQRWQDIERAHGVATHLGATDISIARLDRGYLVQWNGVGARDAPATSGRSAERQGKRWRSQRADVVILAVGFGKEERTESFPHVISYWDGDSFDAAQTQDAQKPLVLVSGTGDGGLIDALRFSFKNFKHHEVLRQLRETWLYPDSWARVKRELATLEDRAVNARKDKRPYEAELNIGYRELLDSLVLKKQISLRDDVDVVLTGMSSYPLTLEAAPINRFLFALSNAQYIPGPIEGMSRQGKGPWEVRFRGKAEPKRFQEVVIRHGPKSAMAEHFPDILKRCEPLIQRAMHGRDPTREPCYDPAFAAALKAVAPRPVPLPDLRGVLDVALLERTAADTDTVLVHYRAWLEARQQDDQTEVRRYKLRWLSRNRAELIAEWVVPGARSTRSADWMFQGAGLRVIRCRLEENTTTLLQQLSREALRRDSALPFVLDARRVLASPHVPFFVAAIEAGLDTVRAVQELDAGLLNKACHQCMLEGRLIVLLDGFDDLDPSSRKHLMAKIEADAANQRRGNRLVIASRFEVELQVGKLEVESLELVPPTQQQIMSWLASSNALDPTLRRAFAAFPPLVEITRHLPLTSLGWLARWLQGVHDADVVHDSTRVALRELAYAMWSLPSYPRDLVVGLVAPVTDGKTAAQIIDELIEAKLLVARPELTFSHHAVQTVLVADALAHKLNLKSLIAAGLEGRYGAWEILPIALWIKDPSGNSSAILEAWPDSVDCEVLRFRARVLRCYGHPDDAQSTKLADDLHRMVSNAMLASANIVRNLAAACTGLAPAAAEIVVSRISSLLQAPDDEVRIRALHFLGAARLPMSVRVILPLLQAREESVRIAAAEVLGELGDPEAIPALIATYVNHEGRLVFSEVLEAVVAIGGERATEALLEILGDPSLSANYRWPAAKQLGKLGDVHALPALIAACQDPVAVVRANAVGAIGRFADPRVAETVVACLGDEEETVRIAAAEGLVTVVDPAHVSPLLIAFGDAHPMVSIPAGQALVRIARGTLLARIQQVIAERGPGRVGAVSLLGEISDAQVLPMLRTLAKDPDESLRLGAALALAQSSQQEAVAVLIPMVDDPDKDVRYAAIAGLGRHGDSRGVAPIIKRLRGKEEIAVKLVAMGMLGKLGGADAAKALTDVLASDDLVALWAVSPLIAIASKAHVNVLPALASAWQRNRGVPQDAWSAFARAIGKLGGDAGVSILRELVLAGSVPERLAVIEGLETSMQTSAIAGLLLLCEDTDASVRKNACWALQSLPAIHVGPGILAALQDGHPLVVKHAVILCPFYGNASTIDTLDKIDPSPWDPDGDKLLAQAKTALHRKLDLLAS